MENDKSNVLIACSSSRWLAKLHQMVQEIVGHPSPCVSDVQKAWEALRAGDFALLVVDDSLGLKPVRNLLRNISKSALAETLKIILTTHTVAQAMDDLPGNPENTLVLDQPVQLEALWDCFRLLLGSAFVVEDTSAGAGPGRTDEARAGETSGAVRPEQELRSPLGDNPAGRSPESDPQGKVRQETGTKGLTALIADDSAATLHVLRGHLKDLGFTGILVAKDGEKAWQLLESGEKIDLVISDWRMPRRTGIQLLQMIRSSEAHKTLPFIMISSEAGTDSILVAGKHDATAYVVKPFTFHSVRNAVKSALGESFPHDHES